MLKTSGYRAGVLVPSSPLADLVEALLSHLGLQCDRADLESLPSLPSPHLVVADLEAFGSRALRELRERSPASFVLLHPERERPSCVCLEQPCLCRLVLPFSPPGFLMTVRARLARDYEEPPPAPVPRPLTEFHLALYAGWGYDACRLADEVGDDVGIVGVDLNLAQCRRAQALARLLGYDNVSFVAARTESLPFRAGAFAQVLGESQGAALGLEPLEQERVRVEIGRVRGGGP
jgi:hypothetical protein